MGTPIGSLHPDLLYTILFGPGYGESVVLRIPPDRWVVVDCLELRSADSGQIPSLELLRTNRAEWSCVVLTHPHEDHAAGLSALLSHPGQGFVGCVAPYIDPPEAWSRHADAERHLRKGAVEDALSAIQDQWERESGMRWELRAGSFRTVGDARLRALFPDDETMALLGRTPRDPNRFATPLLVEWHDARLLLGSDLLRQGWRRVEIQNHNPPLCEHVAFKVSHHGSKGAQHDCVLGGARRGRLWLVTPWNRGRGLPRFEDDEGMARLLSRENEVHLTALPVKVALANNSPLRTTRQAVRDGRLPGSTRRKVGQGLFLDPVPDPAAGADAWIAAGLDRSGELRDLRHGAASVVVTEGPAGGVRRQTRRTRPA